MPGFWTYVISRCGDDATGSGSQPRGGGPINLRVGVSECGGLGDHGRHHTTGPSCGGREGCDSASTGWEACGRDGGRAGGRRARRDTSSPGIWIGRDGYSGDHVRGAVTTAGATEAGRRSPGGGGRQEHGELGEEMHVQDQRLQRAKRSQKQSMPFRVKQWRRDAKVPNDQ